MNHARVMSPRPLSVLRMDGMPAVAEATVVDDIDVRAACDFGSAQRAEAKWEQRTPIGSLSSTAQGRQKWRSCANGADIG